MSTDHFARPKSTQVESGVANTVWLHHPSYNMSTQNEPILTCEVEENSEKPFRISFLAGAATAGGAAGSEGKDGRTG